MAQRKRKLSGVLGELVEERKLTGYKIWKAQPELDRGYLYQVLTGVKTNPSLQWLRLFVEALELLGQALTSDEARRILYGN